ncbi:MAG TPA: glycerol-3-phosphate acyltransferase [Trueperaceae bacterium]
MFDLFAGLGLGYIFGSFPSAVVVARLSGRNIFEVGSGNMGAMNTARNIGWLPGVVVFLLDIAKGAAPVVIAQLLTTDSSDATRLVMPLAAGSGAVAGHAWSAFAGLRGGKALATTLGVALPVYPVAALYTLLLLIALVLITRRTTLSALVAIAAYPAVVMAVLLPSGVDQDRAFAILTSVLVIAGIVVYKHLSSPRSRRTS